MTLIRICAALVTVVAAWSFSGQARSQTSQANIELADLFKVGQFDEARKGYARVADKNPNDYSAVLQLGRIALLSNQLNDAQKWFEQALRLQPDDIDAKVMLAEAFYRRDDFQQAAAALNGVDVSTNKLVIEQYPTLNVATLESFKGETPYELHGEGQTTRLKFIRSDPLPLVNVRVNGGEEVTFFIDTGGSEVTLDSEFAKELGLPQFGEVQGTFSGGEHTQVGLSRIQSLTLGDWTVTNLPIATIPLRQLSKGLGAKRIDGVLGTTLFYHFLATLDFRNGELVLRRKNAQSQEQFAAASSGKSVAVPFWIASDHFMVGWGRVNTLPSALLFVDTGLAGAGVKLAHSAIEKAGIKLEEDKAYEGAGGAGKLKIVPYTVSQLSFGDVLEHNVPGLYDGPFPWEHTFGFYLAGMVGHDFFKPYAVTFDFQAMRIVLQQ
jgi:predicted aspartyl protease/Tfp pilus assembly protein PilF